MRITLAGLLIPVLLLAATSAAPVPKEKPRQHYLPTTVGAKWVYLRGGREVTEFVYAVERSGGATTVTVAVYLRGDPFPAYKMTESETGVFYTSPLFGETAPTWCVLKLPHRPGNTWQRGSNAGKGVSTADGPEEVVVPAGTYRAVRVEEESTLGGGFRGTKPPVSMSWYAPGVGLVKRVTHGGKLTEVLKSFDPGKGVIPPRPPEPVRHGTSGPVPPNPLLHPTGPAGRLWDQLPSPRQPGG
jgi:hypothetical protein